MKEVVRAAFDLARRFEAEDWPAALVGGAPRDLLLGRPCHDVDLVVDASLETLEERFSGTRILGHPPRRSALVPWRKHHFEVVSLGDRPLEEELSRRDFTINSLALTTDLKLVDPFGGGRDLASRRLRFNGSAETRLTEDPLRALRLFRFAATLPGFSIDGSSLRAAAEADLTATATERRGGELLRAASGNLPLFLQLLRRSGLLSKGYPPLTLLEEPEVGGRTDRRLHRLCPLSTDVSLRLATLLFDALPLPAIDEALADWQWPHEVAASVKRLLTDEALRNGEDLFAGRHMKWSRQERQRLFAFALAAVDDEKSGRRWIEARARALAAELRRLDEKRPLDGRDVMTALHCPPGPEIGRLLHALDEALARGEVTGREEALLWLREKVSPFRSSEGESL